MKTITDKMTARGVESLSDAVTLSEISDKMAYPNFYIIPTNRAIA